MVRRLGGLDGWVSRPFLPAAPPCTTGFTPLVGSICPTEPTESEPQRTLAVHPLPSTTPFRAIPGRTDVVSSTTERAATPLPPALLSNKLQLRIRAFCSIGFYLHRPRIAPEVDCISVEISAPRKYLPIFSRLRNRYPFDSRQSNLKEKSALGYHSRARMM